MNYSSRSFYQAASGTVHPIPNYSKYSNSKLLSEKKALQNSYNIAMKSFTPSKSSHIVCLKSAPIDSSSDDDFLNNIVLPSRNPMSPIKSNFSPKNVSKPQSSNQHVMDYFNDFNASLASLQNEITEIRSMIASNLSSPNVK